MKKKCVIGRAELIDLPGIAKLYEEVYEEWACLNPMGFGLGQSILSMESVIEAYRSGTLLAVKAGENLVGACVAAPQSEEEEGGAALCLRGLAVHPDCPAPAVASQLLEYCVGMMEQVGAKRIRLDSQPMDPELRHFLSSLCIRETAVSPFLRAGKAV